MDYAAAAEVVRHSGWLAFRDSEVRRAARLILFTTAGDARLDDFAFQPNDILLFGRESAGAPPEVHTEADARVRAPMAAGARSLNLATMAAIGLWEATRQTGLLARF